MAKRVQFDLTEQEIVDQLTFCAWDLFDYAKTTHRDDLMRLSRLLENYARQVKAPAPVIRH